MGISEIAKTSIEKSMPDHTVFGVFQEESSHGVGEPFKQTPPCELQVYALTWDLLACAAVRSMASLVSPDNRVEMLNVIAVNWFMCVSPKALKAWGQTIRGNFSKEGIASWMLHWQGLQEALWGKRFPCVMSWANWLASNVIAAAKSHLSKQGQAYVDPSRMDKSTIASSGSRISSKPFVPSNPAHKRWSGHKPEPISCNLSSPINWLGFCTPVRLAHLTTAHRELLHQLNIIACRTWNSVLPWDWGSRAAQLKRIC